MFEILTMSSQNTWSDWKLTDEAIALFTIIK